jgi:hypothetical protein
MGRQRRAGARTGIIEFNMSLARERARVSIGFLFGASGLGRLAREAGDFRP